MANIKTNLRELCVGYFLSNNLDHSQLSPNVFLECCKKNIKNCERLEIHNISENPQSFSYEELQIIQNGSNLAKCIRKVLNAEENPRMIWTGSQTQSGEAVDLIIDNMRLSLKEESFILENMGLYKLINIITNTTICDRGLHIFKTFAPQYFETWFKVTRDLLIKLGPTPFYIKEKEYQSIALIQDGNLILLHIGANKQSKEVIRNFAGCSYNDFERSTTSLVREKVFSKWLKEKVESNKEYLAAKKECAVKAGES
jgi:hypothetical protein